MVHSAILEGKDFIIPALHFRRLSPSTPIFGSEKNENEEGDDKEVGVLEIDDEYSLQGWGIFLLSDWISGKIRINRMQAKAGFWQLPLGKNLGWDKRFYLSLSENYTQGLHPHDTTSHAGKNYHSL